MLEEAKIELNDTDDSRVGNGYARYNKTSTSVLTDQERSGGVSGSAIHRPPVDSNFDDHSRRFAVYYICTCMS